MEWQPGHITIVGLGLLGASLIEAARKRNPQLKITGVSSPATLKKALAAGLIESGLEYDEIDQACLKSDLIILCTPIDHILSLLKKWALNPPRCKKGCIITDVGSTKTEICLQGLGAFPNESSLGNVDVTGSSEHGAIFIGSHPMAGSEKTGMEARDALLFQNASWVVCSPPDPDSKTTDALAKLESFAQGLGARTTRMSPELHDQVAAHVSHLPQLLATALASYIGARGAVVENCLQIAGGGFRDMTRLAASSFAVWEPILRSNQNSIKDALQGFQTHLGKLAADLDRNQSQDYFKNGNSLRSQISTAKKGFALPLNEILVDLEDHPGALLEVFKPLAAEGINVLDVEILKVREGEGGTLMMGFHGNEEADRALKVLSQAGFRARLR